MGEQRAREIFNNSGMPPKICSSSNFRQKKKATRISGYFSDATQTKFQQTTQVQQNCHRLIPEISLPFQTFRLDFVVLTDNQLKICFDYESFV